MSPKTKKTRKHPRYSREMKPAVLVYWLAKEFLHRHLSRPLNSMFLSVKLFYSNYGRIFATKIFLLSIAVCMKNKKIDVFFFCNIKGLDNIYCYNLLKEKVECIIVYLSV